MPVKENLRTAIQSRRVARGLGILDLSAETDSKRNEKLTPYEEERRRHRRERNKLAANRCRRRKRDKLEKLEKIAEELETSNKTLESDIATMKTEMKELLAVLQSHQCTMHPSST